MEITPPARKILEKLREHKGDLQYICLCAEELDISRDRFADALDSMIFPPQRIYLLATIPTGTTGS